MGCGTVFALLLLYTGYNLLATPLLYGVTIKINGSDIHIQGVEEEEPRGDECIQTFHHIASTCREASDCIFRYRSMRCRFLLVQERLDTEYFHTYIRELVSGRQEPYIVFMGRPLIGLISYTYAPLADKLEFVRDIGADGDDVFRIALLLYSAENAAMDDPFCVLYRSVPPEVRRMLVPFKYHLWITELSDPVCNMNNTYTEPVTEAIF